MAARLSERGGACIDLKWWGWGWGITAVQKEVPLPETEQGPEAPASLF